MDRDAQAESVEHGHDGEHLVAGPEHGIGGHDLLSQSVEIAVGQQDALGGPGGAAGVQDDGDVVAFFVVPVFPVVADAAVDELMPPDHGGVPGDLLLLPALRQHVAGLDGPGQGVLDGGDDDVFKVHVPADGFELAVELIQRYGVEGTGFLDEEFDLLLAGQGMDHIGHGPHQVGGVEEAHRLRAVRHRDGDPVAGAHADRLQGAGAGVDGLHHGTVGGLLSHEDIGRLVRIHLRRLFHSLHHAAVGIVQRRGDLAPEGEPGCLYVCGNCLTHMLLPHSLVSRVPPGAEAGN